MEPEPILPYARPVDPPALITARGAATIACRLIALWLLAQSVQQVVAAVAYLVWSVYDGLSGRPAGLAYGFAGLAATLGPIVAAGLLWAAAGWIARRVVPEEVTIGPVGSPNLQPLITVGLVMVGASTVAWSVHDLVRASFLASQTHRTLALWWHDPTWLRSVWSDGAVMGLSAWMIFGGRGISDLVHRARTAGQPATTKSTTQPTE